MILTVMAWGDMVAADSTSNLAASIAGPVFAALGSLIVRRVRNVTGWLLIGAGLGLAIMAFTSSYAIVGVATHPGSVPVPRLVGAASEWTFAVVLAFIALLFLMFPAGTLPSVRWRVFAGAVIALTGLFVVGLVLSPRLVALPAPGGISLQYPNPVGVDSLRHLLPPSLLSVNGLWAPTIAFLAGDIVALAIRYRRGTPGERHQIKWLSFTAVAGVPVGLTSALSAVACGCDQSPLALLAGLVFGLIVLFGIPAAIAVAILKYRLYEIDRIINRALVYGLLTAILAGVYVGLAVGLGSLAGRDNSLVIAGSTLVVAALFRPARRRIQGFIDRRFYRRKYDAQRTLESFTARLREEVDLEELHSHLLAVVDETVRPASMSLWLREGGG